MSHARQDELRTSAVELRLFKPKDIRVADRGVRSRNAAIGPVVVVVVAVHRRQRRRRSPLPLQPCQKLRGGYIENRDAERRKGRNLN